MCFYCTAFGQWVVSDPALTQLSQITWAKELKQAYEQFQVLGESRDILTKSLDLYRQVYHDPTTLIKNILLQKEYFSQYYSGENQLSQIKKELP